MFSPARHSSIDLLATSSGDLLLRLVLERGDVIYVLEPFVAYAATVWWEIKNLAVVSKALPLTRYCRLSSRVFVRCMKSFSGSLLLNQLSRYDFKVLVNPGSPSEALSLLISSETSVADVDESIPTYCSDVLFFNVTPIFLKLFGKKYFICK